MEFTFGQKFDKGRSGLRSLRWADWLAILLLIALVYVGVRLALDAPEVVKGPAISLSPAALPWYALNTTPSSIRKMRAPSFSMGRSSFVAGGLRTKVTMRLAPAPRRAPR